ncbi:MAG: magnesium transporter [Gemmatimonadaceae bacterium]
MELLDEAPEQIAVETEEMHPADLADVAEALPRERVAALLSALPPARAADVLEYLDDDLRTEVLEAMTTRQAAALVTEMTPDDRADALEELEDATYEEILSEIPAEARRETERLIAYEADTAGGIMTTEFVSVNADTLVEDALAGVRQLARGPKHEAMHAIYATDAQNRLQGVLSLRELLAAVEGSTVGDVAWSEVVSVTPSADREQVARLTQNYDLVAIPVVDDKNRIIGVVTVDDVIDALQEEHTEDVQKFGGMEALDQPYTQIGFWQMIKKRAGWLSILMVSELLTTSVLSHFEGELKAATVLMLFVPLVMSSGGNSGSQATSLIIRALALGELRVRDWWRVALREIPSGMVLGGLLGAIGFCRIVIWQNMGWQNFDPHYLLVATTIAFALVGIVTFGSLAGSMLPFALRRLGFDPASASAPFVATLVDVTGLSIYFYVAFIILRGTLL